MRYKEYNPNRVLEKCIQLFWKSGFKANSINDIVEATGVNRYSLYSEFTDKNGILYNSLKLYRERYCEERLAILSQDGSPYDLIKKFYYSFLDTTTANQGCYIIHIGTELADTDQKINEVVKSYLSEICVLMEDLLQKDGLAKVESLFFAKQLVALFCTAMSFCLIHGEEEKDRHISYGLNVILDKAKTHATSTR
ncbi:MAG: TetR/AcrR family transcriptional regulator [Cyclobacteriaceae bacterium]